MFNVNDKQEYDLYQQKMLEMARHRPAMFLGPLETAHRWPIKSAFHLIWDFPIFCHPKSMTIVLAPDQYVLILESGPLIQPIQKLLNCEGKYVLTHGWDEAIRAGIDLDHRHQDWRYSWSGPTGPRFYGVLSPSLFSHQFFFGVRFETKFWGQMLHGGTPASPAASLDFPESIGLVIAGHLDKNWFTGLPFDLDDEAAIRANITSASYPRLDNEREFVQRSFEKRQFPNTKIVLRSENDLFSHDMSINQEMWATISLAISRDAVAAGDATKGLLGGK